MLGFVLGICFGIIMAVGMVIVAAMSVTGPAGAPQDTFMLALVPLSLAISILSILGWWWFTEPDPTFVGTDVAIGYRKALRILVLLYAASMTASALLGVASYFNPTPLIEALEILVALGMMLAGIAQFFLAMLYIRTLARRIPDNTIIDRAGRYMWLLPLIYILGLCIAIGPLIAAIMYVHLIWSLRKAVINILDRRHGDGMPGEATFGAAPTPPT